MALLPRAVEERATEVGRFQRGAIKRGDHRLAAAFDGACGGEVARPQTPAPPTKPRADERTCWTPKETAAFLRHNAEQYADQLAGLG